MVDLGFTRSGCDKNLAAAGIYEHLPDGTQGVLGDGPGVQHRPLQHTLFPGQHLACFPLPQQAEPLGQHVPLQQVWPPPQHWLPHAVWPLGQVVGAGSGPAEPQDTVPKPKDASMAPPTAVHTSLTVCLLEMGLAIIRDTSSRNALIRFLL